MHPEGETECVSPVRQSLLEAPAILQKKLQKWFLARTSARLSLQSASFFACALRLCAAAPYRPDPLLPHGTTPASYKVLIPLQLIPLQMYSFLECWHFIIAVQNLIMTPVTVGSNLLLCITGIVYTCKVVLSEGVLGNGYYYRS